jgi:hypothetical protein
MYLQNLSQYLTEKVRHIESGQKSSIACPQYADLSWWEINDCIKSQSGDCSATRTHFKPVSLTPDERKWDHMRQVRTVTRLSFNQIFKNSGYSLKRRRKWAQSQSYSSELRVCSRPRAETTLPSQPTDIIIVNMVWNIKLLQIWIYNQLSPQLSTPGPWYLKRKSKGALSGNKFFHCSKYWNAKKFLSKYFVGKKIRNSLFPMMCFSVF